MKSAALVLEDGATFTGELVGADAVGVGEVVFNTAMTGYQEVVTDPSYAGQIVTMTAPHIGNYGVTEADVQARRPFCSGFVMRSLTRTTSSWRAEGSLADYLAAAGVPAISGIDTRRLTRHLRSRGAMGAALGDATTADLQALAAAHGGMGGKDLVGDVTTPVAYEVAAIGPERGRVVAYDLGIKRDILTRLATRGLAVTVVPASTPAQEVLAHDPSGAFLSNGPGDPEPVTATVDAVTGLLGKVPVFGICLGHQILGLALGARTYKLGFGHHGSNHPVQRLADGSVAVTSQNHGFAVDLWSLSDRPRPEPETGTLPGPDLLPEVVATRFGAAVPTHQNLNDGTLEGLRCLDVPAFSVQYHPEAAPGPRDAEELFDEFVTLMGVGT